MKILVWLSWWVDSAVAAYLLKQQWHEVVAGFMINYMDDENPNCSTKADRQSAMEVCKYLQIPFEIFDYREEYEKLILNYIYEWYQKWITPNPDVYCNNLVKFGLFLDEAKELWFEAVATGHYARIVRRFWDYSEDFEDKKKIIDKKTYDIIWVCMKIHQDLWNTLTEKQYENILKDTLVRKWYEVKQQVSIDITYEGKKYWNRFIDIVVDNSVVLELKKNNNEYDLKKWFRQIRSYIDLWGYDSWLLLDFWWISLKYNRFNSNKLIESLQSSEQSLYLLKRWVDHNKDQSYFLSWLNQNQLSKALFPLGEYTKPQIRQIAKDAWLPNANRPDSQGLCFVWKVNMKDFLIEKIGKKPGYIYDLAGNVVGEHDGAYVYTIGQRRNIWLNFQCYVCDVDVLANRVVVARVGEEDVLYASKIYIHNCNWISGTKPKLGKYTVKIRYRQEPVDCELGFVDQRYFLTFPTVVKWIANGQIAVLYDGERVVWNWVISKE